MVALKYQKRRSGNQGPGEGRGFQPGVLSAGFCQPNVSQVVPGVTPRLNGDAAPMLLNRVYPVSALPRRLQIVAWSLPLQLGDLCLRGSAG